MKNETEKENKDRQTQLTNLCNQVAKGIKSPFILYSGNYLISGKWQFRFDICRECDKVFVLRRGAGIQYGVHNPYHYNSGGKCLQHSVKYRKNNNFRCTFLDYKETINYISENGFRGIYGGRKLNGNN